MHKAGVMAVTVALLLTSACAGPYRPAEDPVDATAAAEGDGFQHLISLYSGNQVHVRSSAEQLKYRLHGARPGKAEFHKPFDVATRAGLVYVTDTQAGLVHVLDIPRRRYYFFGYRPEGRLHKPTGIAIAGNGEVYVCDSVRNSVLVFDGLGLFQRAVGDRESLANPVAVALDSSLDRVYVLDNGGIDSDLHRVVAYDTFGQPLFSFGERGKGPGEFNLPADIAVAEDGTIHVLDAGNFRVQAFDPDGRFLRSWGEIGNRAGNLARPRRMAMDAQGNLYISDAFFGKVQVFDEAGGYLRAVGQNAQADGPGRFSLVAGVRLDELGQLYVVDQYFRKVEVFRKRP